MHKHTYYQWRPHPWHGLEIGPHSPRVVRAYIEMTPLDGVKYEMDKATGYLKVDRPQRTSSLTPTLYGFIPRTYCGERVGRLTEGARYGDRDPLDICVLTERPIHRAEILVEAQVVGGMQMLDNQEADDKIVAVLSKDPAWAEVDELADLPGALVDRIKHYFSTYKQLPGEPIQASVVQVYGRERAEAVIRAAMEDYGELLKTLDHHPA